VTFLLICFADIAANQTAVKYRTLYSWLHSASVIPNALLSK